MNLGRPAYLLFCFLSAARLFAQSVGGVTSGSAYFCDSLNSGFISLTGFNGSVLFWQFSNDGGRSWKPIANTNSTQSYNHLKESTSFRAIVRDGFFPVDTSSSSTINVHVPGTGGVLTGGGVFCASSGSGTLSLGNTRGKAIGWQFSTDAGFSWKDTPGGSAVLQYTNIAQDTRFRAIVQTFSLCPSDTSAIASFTIHEKTRTGFITGGDTLCYGASGDSLRLEGYKGDIGGWYLSPDGGGSWSPLDTKSAAVAYTTVTRSYLYRATVKNGICAAETTAVCVLGVYNVSPAHAGGDLGITRHEKVNLQGSGQGRPSWSPVEGLEDAGSWSPPASPLNTTTYVLTVTDEHGCSSSDEVIVHVTVPVPSAISPNGDGVNDFFEVDKIEQYEKSSLLVLNRWGNLVYKEAPYRNQWNGKSLNGRDLPDDTYYFVLDLGNGEAPLSSYILIKR